MYINNTIMLTCHSLKAQLCLRQAQRTVSMSVDSFQSILSIGIDVHCQHFSSSAFILCRSKYNVDKDLFNA